MALPRSDAPRSPLSPVSLVIQGALPAVVMASVIEFLPLLGVTLETLAALLAAALLAGAWRGRATVLTGAWLRRVVPVMVVTVLVAAGFPLLDGTTPRNYAVFGAAAPTLMGWALLFWLAGNDDTSNDAGNDNARNWLAWEPPRWALPAILVGGGVLLALVHHLAVGTRAIVSDETIYLLQSEWFRNPGYAWAVDRELLPFFLMRKLGVTPDGGLYGMYTPGWPAMLALFDVVGLRWWSGVILGVVALWLTYRLGAHLHSRAAGVLGAALLAVQPWFLVLHAGYMAHPATIVTLTLAALWLLESEERTGWERTLRWLGVGVAIAVAVTVRPLTGVGFGASLGLWLVLRGRMPVATLVRCAATVVVGALPLAAWFFHYNAVTNGEMTRVSYQALHGDGYNIGFGIRGFTGVDAAGDRVPLPVTFTPRDAVVHLLQRMAGINYSFFPYALFAPIVVALAAFGRSPRWRVVAVFLLLPALHFFYWGSEIRFYSEYLPFLTVWVAAGALSVMAARPGLGAGMLVAVVASSVVLNVPGRWPRIPLDAPWMRSDYTGSAGRFATFEQLETMQRERGQLLVFVRERVPLYDILIDRLYRYNAGGFEGDILVARDLGERNAVLLARFPDRTPVLVEDNGRERPATITELPRD